MKTGPTINTAYSNLRKNPIPLAFLLSFLYWGYLFFASKMYVSADAVGYESLGKLLLENGWVQYFQSGPQREPLYPLLISVSMKTAGFLQIPYQSVQKILQIFLLTVTQGLIFLLAKKLKVSDRVIFFVLLYFGFSPIVVNTGFSLFSEIVTFPLLLGIVLVGAEAWQAIVRENLRRAAFQGLGLGLLFLCIISVKGIFEYIFLFFICPYLCLLFIALFRRQKKLFFVSVLFTLCIVLVYKGGTVFYKSLNQKYNGHFTITDRGSWLMYGNTARRTGPLSARQYLTALASIPGEGVCRAIFKEECDFWSFKTSDGLGLAKRAQIQSAGMDEDKIDAALIETAKQEILKKPFAYIVLGLMESARMLFWESTQIGFVAYPPWLKTLFENLIFKNGLRFLVFVLTCFALWVAFSQLWRNKTALLSGSANTTETTILFFTLFLLLSYIALYSLVSIVARFAIPLAPIYLIAIGIFLDRIIRKFCK